MSWQTRYFGEDTRARPPPEVSLRKTPLPSRYKHSILTSTTSHQTNLRKIPSQHKTLLASHIVRPPRTKGIQHREILMSADPFEALLLKHSDRMRLIYWAKENSMRPMRTLIISADMLINQDDFWEDRTAELSALDDPLSLKSSRNRHRSSFIKEWRDLHSSGFVVWVVRRKSSYSKLKSISEHCGASLHGVFHVRPKHNYTIDYSPIVREINKLAHPNASPTNPTEFVIMETLKINTRNILDFSSFAGRVPVVLHTPAKIYFVRVENTPGMEIIQTINRFDGEQQSNQVKSYELAAVKHYINQQMEGITQNKVPPRSNYHNQESEDVDLEGLLDRRMEILRQQLVHGTLQTRGPGFKFEGDRSVHYFVGDLLKRNRAIMLQCMEAELQVRHTAQGRKEKEKRDKEKREKFELRGLEAKYFQFTLF